MSKETKQARTKADANQLLENTIDLIIAGLAPGKIFAHLKINFTNAPKNTKQRQELLALATEELRRRFTEYAEVELEVSTSRLNDLYARALRIQDYKTCLAIQKEINDLRKLRDAESKPPAKPESEDPTDHPMKVTPGTIKDRYRQNMQGDAAG